jgi:SOS-response transcriptional repressor LexA
VWVEGDVAVDVDQVEVMTSAKAARARRRDHVVVVAADPRPAPGAMAVVLISEEATVKDICYDGASIRLTSSNPDFPDQVYGADINADTLDVIHCDSEMPTTAAAAEPQ